MAETGPGPVREGLPHPLGANGEDNNDGNSDNRSWNCSAEGPSGDPAINALRERQIRNILGTLLLSLGTPISAGPEIQGYRALAAAFGALSGGWRPLARHVV